MLMGDLTVLSPEHDHPKLDELIQSVEYHERQQRMQNEYFEQWRRKPPFFSGERAL